MVEVRLDKKTSEKLEAFMKGGKLRVFECGEKRPEFIQERPFFGLLPEGQTSYIEPGVNGENCTVSVGEPAKDYILDTENHRFFKQIEERFRNVRPDMTLFVIDPDVVMGRYATDDEPDRSIGKSLYLHIVEKLKEANVYGKTPIDESYVEPVIDSAITSSNAFSATNPVGVTKKNLDGERNISLVVGDNPDTLVDDMFYWVPGVKERMEKEGVTRRQLQQFTLYHEFGHALDPAHKGGFKRQFTENNVDAQLARHRTECLADAHAVLQLARDYGQTDISVLIGDVRIETMHNLIKKYTEKQPTTRLEAAIDREAEKNLKVKRGDSKEIAELKTLQTGGARYAELKKVGDYLAYYTTGVVDAAIKIANEKLADGSLMKMKDVEVLDLADQISKTYGLSKEEMSRLRIDLVDNKPNPLINQIMQRTDEAFARMPLPREQIEKMYDVRKKKSAEKHNLEVEEALGIVRPQTEVKMTEAQLVEMIAKMEAVAAWRSGVYDKIAREGANKDALISTITHEKEVIRKASVNDPAGKEKMDLLNAEFIGEAPSVLKKAKANQAVFRQIQEIPAKQAIPQGDDALIAFISYEISTMDRMSSLLEKTANRDFDAMTVDEQLKALQKDRAEFTKVMTSERMAQLVAAEVCKDKGTLEKSYVCPSLSDSLLLKADGKHPEWMTDFQMNFTSPNPAVAKELLTEIEEQKFTLVSDMANDPEISNIVLEKKPSLMRNAMKFAQNYMNKVDAQQEGLGKAPKMDLKTFSKLNPRSSR